jgi:hypothetical protein
MGKNMKRVLCGMLVIIGLAFFVSGTAIADEVSITGTINEDGKLVDDNDVVYDIADNEEGGKLMEMEGDRVTVMGTVDEVEGVKTITATEFKLLEE